MDMLYPRKAFIGWVPGRFRNGIKGFLYISLMFLCYYTDGVVMLNGKEYTCRRGEYIGTHELIADQKPDYLLVLLAVC